MQAQGRLALVDHAKATWQWRQQIPIASHKIIDPHCHRCKCKSQPLANLPITSSLSQSKILIPTVRRIYHTRSRLSTTPWRRRARINSSSTPKTRSTRQPLASRSVVVDTSKEGPVSSRSMHSLIWCQQVVAHRPRLQLVLWARAIYPVGWRPQSPPITALPSRPRTTK